MHLTGLADAVLADPTLAAALTDANTIAALDLTGPAALRPFAVKGLVDAGRTVLAVTATAREAEDLVEELGDLIDPGLVGYYPSWETLPHERLSPRSDTIGRRLAVLRRICNPGTTGHDGPLRVVVAPVRSLLQPQVKGLGDLEPVALGKGDTVDLDDVVRRLANAAYSRVDLVERRGEFAVRGGIVDIFPPTEEHPLRVEFWGDDVEEIRSFAVADQRTLETVERLWAPPCRELLLTDDVRRRAAELGEAHPQLVELTDKIAAGIAVEGMESLAPVLVDEMEMLTELMPADTHVLVLDPERARSRAHDLVATSEEFLGASWAAAASGGVAPIDLGAASYRELGGVREQTLGQGKAWWTLSPFGLDDSSVVEPVATSFGGRSQRFGGRGLRCRELDHLASDLDKLDHRGELDHRGVESRVVTAKPSESYRGDIEQAVVDIQRWLSDGWRVAVLHPGLGPAKRMVEVLGSTTSRRGWSRTGRATSSATADGVVDRHDGRPPARPGPRGPPTGDPDRRRPVRSEGIHPRHAQDAGPPQEADRPARAQGRRLRGPRAARRRPVRGDETARGAGRDA